jgi:hypothetical protein
MDLKEREEASPDENDDDGDQCISYYGALKEAVASLKHGISVAFPPLIHRFSPASSKNYFDFVGTTNE